MMTLEERAALATLKDCQRRFREDVIALIELEKLKASGNATPEDYENLKSMLQ